MGDVVQDDAPASDPTSSNPSPLYSTLLNATAVLTIYRSEGEWCTQGGGIHTFYYGYGITPYILQRPSWSSCSIIFVRRLFSSLVCSSAKSSSLYVSVSESIIVCGYTRYPMLFEVVDTSSSIQLRSFSLRCICACFMAIVHSVLNCSTDTSNTCVCE